LNVTLPFQLRRMRPMDDGCLRCISIEQLSGRPAGAASIYSCTEEEPWLWATDAPMRHFLRHLASDPERPAVMHGFGMTTWHFWCFGDNNWWCVLHDGCCGSVL